MNPVDKKHFWQKKTFWGIVVTAAGIVAEQVPGIPHILAVLILAVGGATGTYGYTEVQRARAAAAQRVAECQGNRLSAD
jgi:hypothetical protein